MPVLIAVIAAALLLALGVAATLMFAFGMLGWMARGEHRCPRCHYIYLTRMGHASWCDEYPHPLHAASMRAHHPIHPLH